jgi:hypothetical protein
METASQESESTPSIDSAGEGGNFVETATRTTGDDDAPEGGGGGGGDLGDSRQEFWKDAEAGQADKRKTMERPRKAEVQPADDPDYPFHMNTEVGMELIDARRTEDGGLKGDSAMVFDTEANNGKEENKRKNFFKSDTFFQEIVEDTRNLAEATDMIQKALGHHNKALLDIKDKFANMKTKYEGAIKIVSTGFEKVKNDAEKLLTEKFEADPFADRQKLENYNEKDAEGDEEKKKNIDDFEFKDDPWKAWEPSVTDGEDDGRKKKDPLLAEINKLKDGGDLNGGYEVPPPPAPLNGEGGGDTGGGDAPDHASGGDAPDHAA